MNQHGHQPRYWAYCGVLAFLSCIMATSLWAGPLSILADKPADPGFVFTRSIFDCTARQMLTISPGFTITIVDSTFGTGSVDGYACRQWSETGPEAFYALTIDSEVDLFAGLRDMGDLDLDLFLLSECDNDSCLIGANIEFNLRLQPGTYILVVDGYSQPEPQSGLFTLEISAREPGLPESVCNGPDTVPVDCQLQTEIFSDDLTDLPDLVRTNACTLSSAQAGEKWYAVTVAGYHEFTATVTDVPPTLDPVLWLFPECGSDIQCLDFVDEKIDGQTETLTWSNASFLPTTVYLGMDAFLPPAGLDQGTYTLEIRCQAMVEVERKSLGSIRAQFR